MNEKNEGEAWNDIKQTYSPVDLRVAWSCPWISVDNTIIPLSISQEEPTSQPYPVSTCVLWPCHSIFQRRSCMRDFCFVWILQDKDASSNQRAGYYDSHWSDITTVSRPLENGQCLTDACPRWRPKRKNSWGIPDNNLELRLLHPIDMPCHCGDLKRSEGFLSPGTPHFACKRASKASCQPRPLTVTSFCGIELLSH